VGRAAESFVPLPATGCGSVVPFVPIGVSSSPPGVSVGPSSRCDRMAVPTTPPTVSAPPTNIAISFRSMPSLLRVVPSTRVEPGSSG
jgi:hypothetical protein